MKSYEAKLSPYVPILALNLTYDPLGSLQASEPSELPPPLPPLDGMGGAGISPIFIEQHEDQTWLEMGFKPKPSVFRGCQKKGF